MAKDTIDSAFWRIVQFDELVSDRRRLWTGAVDGADVEIVFTHSGLWIVITWGSGASVAVRAAFSPRGLTVTECGVGTGAVQIELETPIGPHTTMITIGSPVLSFRTSVRPRGYHTLDAWARDIVPLPLGVDGVVHTAQRELRTGLIHASMIGSRSGSFMYAQELLALAPLCEATRTSVARAVGGEWPDIGYELPRGRRALRPSDDSLVLTHAHLTWASEVPHGDGEVMDQYLGFSEAIYRKLGRPAHDRISHDDDSHV